MPTLVTGTIDSPEENRSRIEPVGPVLLGVMQPNDTRSVSIGNYANTGNVPQTVSVQAANILNETGITFIQSYWRDTDNGQIINQPSVTLQPGSSRQLWISFKTDDAPVGSADPTVSFEVSPTWS